MTTIFTAAIFLFILAVMCIFAVTLVDVDGEFKDTKRNVQHSTRNAQRPTKDEKAEHPTGNTILNVQDSTLNFQLPTNVLPSARPILNAKLPNALRQPESDILHGRFKINERSDSRLEVGR